MKIGVFLAYMPGVKLGSEGLGRYIGNLIKGFTDDRNEVSVACPKWLVDSLYDLFADFHIAEDSVEIITTRDVPVIWQLYMKRLEKKDEKKPGKKALVLRMLSDIIDHIIFRALQISSMPLFMVFFLFCFLAFVLFLPLLLVIGILGLAVWGILKQAGKQNYTIGRIVDKISETHQRYSKSRENLMEFSSNALYKRMVGTLVRKANRKKTDTWFVPTLFWPEAVGIKTTTVFAAPDLVTMEFPFPFAGAAGSLTATKRCEQTVIKGKYFITYGEFIKYDVLMKRYGKTEDHVASVAHINNSSLPYVDAYYHADPGMSKKVSCRDAFCRELLYRLPPYSSQKENLEGFDFEHAEYIFYASQQRPHKNIINLLKAYEYLLREKDIEFKLFLTCDLSFDPGIAQYISEHHLEHYVISFQRIPVQLLSALYCCAKLVVTPTLYEGAFLSFTVGEGMSVGTPCIMGSIPQVLERIPSRYSLEDILFDPYNYMDIAQKILYGMEHANELYLEELPMYEDIASRTGSIVARDYVEVFKRFRELNEAEKNDKKKREKHAA